MDFTEDNIARLFGYEAAEDESSERLRDYYFKGSVFKRVVNEQPLRILVGHKGVGKSALFRVAIHEGEQSGNISLLIRPDDIIEIGSNEKDLLKLIREWKRGLIEIIASEVLTTFGDRDESILGKIKNSTGKIIDILQSTLHTEKYIANKNSIQKLLIENFIKSGNIYVYIDDLDRGWEGREEDVKRLSALLNAARDISAECRGIKFRISLRSDVYYLVRTSDESTDKIEGAVVWYSWSNHEILAMLVKRVDQFFDLKRSTEELIAMPQDKLANGLNRVMEERFEGYGKWNNIPTYRMLMSLIRKRPRDLVKLCTLAAQQAMKNNHSRINSGDFHAIFYEYSQGRMQDTINEYNSELPEIERLLLGMRPSEKDRKNGIESIYKTQNLIKKIDSISQRGIFRFRSKKNAGSKEIAAFLYKINFITARKEVDGGIDRKYFEENRYLQSEFVDFGYDWEIHPAYRWVLQPEKSNNIFSSIVPSV